MNIIRVSAKTSPNVLARAIADLMKDDGVIHLRAVGAAAINQAVKAIAICRIIIVATGADIVCTPWFSEVTIEDERKTAITFSVELRWPEIEISKAA